jgi:hypothetical protein
MKNYISTEHLEKIVVQQKELNSLFSNIGLLETQKHELLHSLAEFNRGVEEFKLELQKEYGKININIEDGSYETLNDTDDEPTLKKV